MKLIGGLVRVVFRLIVWAILLSLAAWGTLVLYYSPIASESLRSVLSGGFALLSAVILLFVRPRRRAILGFFAVFAVLMMRWLGLAPANDRDWQPDVAVLPYVTFTDDAVTIHNIRNNDYRSETDFAVQYYDKTFHLSQLRSVDLFLSYWGPTLIAHTIMSFGFEGDEYIAFSIETRKEKGEEYSAIRGFFKQYELIYVAGDERDLVRLRTNYRGEDVYLYRLQGSPEVGREVFLQYLRDLNELSVRPAWYNALTENCTTGIYRLAQPYAGRAWWDWRLFVNGYLPELAYDIGAVDRSLPFSEFKARSLINERAQAAGQDLDFSQKIRAGLPGIQD